MWRDLHLKSLGEWTKSSMWCYKGSVNSQSVLPPAAAPSNYYGKHSYFPRRKVQILYGSSGSPVSIPGYQTAELLHVPRRKVHLSDMTAVYMALAGALRKPTRLQANWMLAGRHMVHVSAGAIRRQKNRLRVTNDWSPVILGHAAAGGNTVPRSPFTTLYVTKTFDRV